MERERRGRGRQHLAADGQDAVHLTDALLEVAALDGGHRGDQQVPDRVAAQSAAGPLAGLVATPRETVFEQLVHQRLGIREGRDAPPDVADGGNPELLAKDAARTAVIRAGDDGGEVAGVVLEAAEECRETGPTADGDD